MDDVAHALVIDLYELTMVDAYRREAMADRRRRSVCSCGSCHRIGGSWSPLGWTTRWRGWSSCPSVRTIWRPSTGWASSTTSFGGLAALARHARRRPGEHRVGELVAADAPIDGFTKLMGLPILVRVSSRAVTVTSTELIVGSSSPRCR